MGCTMFMLLLVMASMAIVVTADCYVEVSGWAFNLNRAYNGQYVVAAHRSDGRICALTFAS